MTDMTNETTKLKKRDRQSRVLEEFRASPRTRLGDLARHFGVAKETIRRDIDELSAKGLLERTYGGAVASFLNSEPGIKERALANPQGRRQMARRAVELLADIGIMMIDTGATTAHVCERLAAEVPRSGRVELTAITNSLRNVAILGANPSIRVMVCPGDYDEREDAVFGTQTIEFVSRFNADIVVMSAGGVTANVVTDANSEAAAVKRAMLRQSERSMLVIERQKFELSQFERVCLLDEFDLLVTDEAVSRDLIASLSSDKVHVAAGA